MIRLKKRILIRKKSFLLFFINRFILQGKKDFIYKTFIKTLIKLKRIFHLTFKKILVKFLYLITPKIQLLPKFASGIIYLIPFPVKLEKSNRISITWFKKAIVKRLEYSLYFRLLFEIQEIFENRGYTLRYKKEYYKIATLNRTLLYKFRKR